MFKSFYTKSKKLMFSEQSSVLSAATLIMVMVIGAKILGFIRQRVLFTYFSPHETDLFLAAFELPDLLFEILVFGIVSAAFIPVYTSYLSKKESIKASYMAAKSLNLVLSLFIFFGGIVFFLAPYIYTFLAGGTFKSLIGIDGGFSNVEIHTIVSLSRVLLIAQVFFVVSAFATGVLESNKRFLLPALAPLLYNLGIIGGIIFLSSNFGLLGPTLGALIGSVMHLAIQLPLSREIGLHFVPGIDFKNEGVKRLLSLSGPRILELSVFQIKRFVWLFLGSLNAGGFTYLKSAELLYTMPISVFGVSLAKAALPTLSQQAGSEDYAKFQKTFLTTLNQILFLVMPISVFMIVLRIPIVRLVFGADQFNWTATIETSYTLSAFSLGIFAYGAALLISRAFYALHDTKTPVTVSVLSVVLNAILGFVLVLGLKTGTWGIALAYSLSGIFQFIALSKLIVKRLSISPSLIALPFSKILISSVTAGFIMRALIRIFDRSVWVKGLSLFTGLETIETLPFERFVVDTRYTSNLLLLTGVVTLVGCIVYLCMLVILRSEEVWAFKGFVKRIIHKKVLPIPAKESERVSPTHSET